MGISYTSEYYGDLSYFRDNGWTDEELNTYFPLLELLNEMQLLALHKLCQIRMFATEDEVDKEQAIHVLVNPHDTPKSLLIESLQTIQSEQ